MRVGAVARGRSPSLHFVQADGRKTAGGIRTGVLRQSLSGILFPVAPDESAVAAYVAGCGQVPGFPYLGVEFLRLAQINGFAGGFVEPDEMIRPAVRCSDAVCTGVFMVGLVLRSRFMITNFGNNNFLSATF